MCCFRSKYAPITKVFLRNLYVKAFSNFFHTKVVTSWVQVKSGSIYCIESIMYGDTKYSQYRMSNMNIFRNKFPKYFLYTIDLYHFYFLHDLIYERKKFTSIDPSAKRVKICNILQTCRHS